MKKVCVVGLGFVGLTLAVVLAERGFKDEKLLALLYYQLETDWRSPMEELIEKLLE